MSHLSASYWTGVSDLLRGRFDAVRHVRSIKTPLDQTHVYSIESKDRLTRFGVTMFLYRIIGDGRNTGVLGVLTMSSGSFYGSDNEEHPRETGSDMHAGFID